MTRTAVLWKRSCLSGLTALAVTICFAGCNNNSTPPSDQQLKQDAAKTTEQVKQGAQEAAADAKVAAANAERKVDDIAAGVKEGLHGDTTPSAGVTPSGAININSASASQLESLPGVSGARAQRIIDNRPYTSPHDLVSKGVVSEAEYSRISGRIVAD
ncbi:MAG TPA: helix-hairpin-helix domain-containing protein [Silvibacterium sp.]|jgi:DNA uptake protein ComE-like DNA-binding protein|nr:helix-hairpin-helix domain-containing protein [Silvibacterium sp.]